ncbi:MAG TPA: NAD-dependent epimerase/dehydratase family protein [Gemmatimonadaceae bacterium]|jgi:UDP-glucose 4-epimerase|nr:NAD-dependent epimerase/dehydratase family protein [Gemmatimonadaceae bacterium]
MARRALISGGAGFIGSHVVRAFRAAGYEVSVLDNLSTGTPDNLPDGVCLHQLDICSPEAAAVVREGRFDVLCHLAAQIDVRKSVADPAFDSRVNIGGSLNLLEAVRASGAPTRFIFSSTGGAVYGDLVEPPTGETAPKDPQSPYGTAKLSVEYYMGYFARVHGLDLVALRYANVYGPRQDPHGEAGVVAIFCDRVIDGAPLTIFGDGSQTRDYVYAGDVARANVLAAHAALPAAAGVDSRAFNIGTSIETDVVALASRLMAVSGGHSAIVHAPARAGEQRRSAVAIAKAERLLGWTPEISLDAGLKETYAWFVARRTAGRA